MPSSECVARDLTVMDVIKKTDSYCKWLSVFNLKQAGVLPVRIKNRKSWKIYYRVKMFRS